MIDETPDGTLLRRYREDRDEAAFAELRRRHGRLVLATCRRETGDAALAEDAAQAVFLLLIRKGFADGASLAGWLHGASRMVSRNLVREERRRRKRERRAYEEFVSPDAAWNAVSPLVDDALAGLGARDREAVLLRFSSEMSLAEVGGVLGIGENAARMRVTRGLERMRGRLARAGVGVSALLLATLLGTRLADAAPLEAMPPSAAASVRPGSGVGRTVRVLPSATRWKAFVLSLGCLAVGLYATRGLREAPELGSMERKLLFSRSVGDWTGTLEYADDMTGRRTTTPANVVVDRPGGGLRMVATYSAYRNVDTTTFTPQGDGRFRIETGGGGSSHRLDGLYRLRQTEVGPAFVGVSATMRGEVRLRVVATPTSLVLEEEYRQAGEYRFRNRFELKRAP